MKKRVKILSMSNECKKKNGKINVSEIARLMNRSPNTILLELKKFKDIESYQPYAALEDYMNKRKKSIRCPKFTDEQLEWLNIRFNKHHDTLMQICKKYEKDFGIKFPVCPKTLHNYIRLGLLGLLKENLFNHGRKNKTKNWKDNRGKLYKFGQYEILKMSLMLNDLK